MGNTKPLRISMLVFVLALCGSLHPCSSFGIVADGYFLASSRVLASEPVFETASKKPEEGAKKVEYVQQDVNKTAVENSQQVGKPDKNMAKAGEGYKPLFEASDHKHEVTEQVKPKYPIIFACHTLLAKVFGKYTETWWYDWKLWVGLTFWCAVWAKWLIHGYDEVYYQRGLHAFGVNIIILHILQYSSSTLTGIIGICTMLLGQTLFSSYWWYAANASEHEMDDFDCDTLYLDLALPIEQIAILFIAQFGVWWFYMTSILGNFDFSNVNYLFWLWAYLVMQMTMIFNRGPDSVLGEVFPLHDVHRLMKMSGQAEFSLLDENGEQSLEMTKTASIHKVGEKLRLSKANIIMRGITGFFCNGILRDIMAYTIPLMLMGFSEPMDFVVYCVGVNFICTLDDMSGRKYAMTEIKRAPDGVSDEATTGSSQ